MTIESSPKVPLHLLTSMFLSSLMILWPSTAPAQKPPQLGYLFPPFVVPGQTVSRQLGGFDFTPDLEIRSRAAGVTFELHGPPGEHFLPPPPYWTGPRASVAALPLPREMPCTVTVPASIPAGLLRWHVLNANGSSSYAQCIVSSGTEVVENRFRDEPQSLESLPIAVSGRLSRLTEVDRYTIVPTSTGILTFDLMARRLGADFEGVLEIRDASGKLLADHSDTLGKDARISIDASAGVPYTISIRDVDFRGDRTYIYRLSIVPGPQVTGTVPACLPRGQSTDVTFYGIGISSGHARLESLKRTVDLSVLSEAQHTTYDLRTPAGSMPVFLKVSDVAESVADQLPVDNSMGARQLSQFPCGVTGRWTVQDSARRFCWNSEKDEVWRLRLQSQELGSNLDVSLTIENQEGQVVAENDDLADLTDSGVVFKASVAGTFTAVVRAIPFPGVDEHNIFRLQVEQASPGFELTAPELIQLPLDGSVDVLVQATRLAGFNDEIPVEAQHLPDGVVMEGDWKIPKGRPSARLKLSAASHARVSTQPIQMTGKLRLNGAERNVVARVPFSGNLAPRNPIDADAAETLLAVTMKPPLSLNLVDRTRQRDVHLGTTCLAEFTIEREPGFTGPVLLEMAAKQARYRRGIVGPTLIVPPEETTAIYPSFMPEWLATDLTERMAVQAVVVVPDPQGRPRHLIQAADAQITMILEGALLKIATSLDAGSATMGSKVTIPFHVARSAKLALDARIELLVPPELEELVIAEPVLLKANQQSGEIDVLIKDQPSLAGEWVITVRATAMQDGKWPVRSQFDLPLIVRPKSVPSVSQADGLQSNR